MGTEDARKPMPRMVDRRCQNPTCGQAFQARAADVARGQGRFCCKSCAKAPSMPLKSLDSVQSWMQTTHTGATWHEVMQYQRVEIELLRQLIPVDVRPLLLELAAGKAYANNQGAEVCVWCAVEVDKHRTDCIVRRARLLVGIPGDQGPQ